jgi:hypothetical protein
LHGKLQRAEFQTGTHRLEFRAGSLAHRAIELERADRSERESALAAINSE